MNSGFSIDNLPYGVFESQNEPHIGVAIEDRILDLHAASELFQDAVPSDLIKASSLNPLLAAGRPSWKVLRAKLQKLLRTELPDTLFVRRDSAQMVLPFAPCDYIDFYSSIEHATNMGKMMRPDGEPLLPNWRWLPIGYHGRTSTVVVDGTQIRRPNGETRKNSAEPTFGPTQMLDIELEVGFITSNSSFGKPIPAAHASEYIFGLVLVNDWSARDIQAWEYQPLGPFNGKSFATSVSPWVVTLDALEPYRVAGPHQDPPALPYLKTSGNWNFDIHLIAEIETERMRQEKIEPQIISRTNYKSLYWNMAQQLAHATSNGASIRAGDLFASGTISGVDPKSYGSLMELTWRGRDPIELPTGERRTFLEDGDTVTLRGCCEAPGKPRIDFGSVSGTVLPAEKEQL